MVGSNIKQYLKDNGIKQSFLVEKTGLSAGVISDLCNGKKKSIDILAYYKICRALGVDLAFFITGGKESEV